MTPESFLQFADPLPEPTLLVSGSGSILAVNRAFADRLGVNGQAWHRSSLADLVVDPPDEIERFVQLCSRSRQPILAAITLRGRNAIACRAEGCVVRPKTVESDAVVMLRVFPKKAAAGQFIALNLRIEELAQEIQRRKEAERQLAESLQFYLSSIDALTSHIAVLDENGVIVAVNYAWRNFAALNGFVGADFGVGMNYLKVCESSRGDRADDGSIASGVRDVLAGRALAFEREYACHSPTEMRWFLMWVRRIKSTGPVRVVITHDDISLRRAAEERLRESNASLLGILQHSPAGIVQTGAAGHMTMVNERWCQMLGYTESELLGKSVLEVTHESSVAMTADAVGRLAAGGPDVQLQKNYVRKNGSLLKAQSNVTAMRSPEGKFEGLIAVVLDVTERLRIEEELRRIATELSASDRRKSEFLATLAHELRNPLVPILNAVEMIARANGNGATVEHARGLIARQLNHLVRLVDDLMDSSRISTGKVELRKERVTLSSVVQGAIESSHAIVEQMGHTLTVTLPTQPLLVDVDSTRLVQILLNLISNAAKYSEPNSRIWLTAAQRGSDLVLSVKDMGIGIAADDLPGVFEMFAQVKCSLEKSQGGLGIGLSLVKSLVELHGGRIEALSEGLGRGSEFVVWLPVVVESFAPPKNSVSVNNQMSPHRILIVDDNRDSADSFAMILRMLGNETCTAYDGEEALAATEKFRPDVILLDIGLPKLNGYETCSRIRTLEFGKGILIIAQTGWGQEEARQRTRQAGFDHHLIKPLNVEELVKLIQ